MKEWIVKRLMVNVVGQGIAKADGKRTWIGSAAFGLLVLAKYVLPVFVAVPPLILEGIDQLIPIVGGSTLAFASVKAQKIWEATKKAGDEIVAKVAVAPEQK